MRHVREILRLRHSAGLGHKPIARRVGVVASTVREVLRRAAAIGVTWLRIPTKSAGGSDFMSAPVSDRSRPGVALAFWLV
jgi:DNA-binding transcriptional regulator LsrR (DeoR family)